MPASTRLARPLSALACAITVLCAPLAHAADPAPIKVAFIDQLSGPLSNVGEQFLANLKLGIDDANAQPQGVVNGARYELTTYDNKLSAQDSLSALQSAIDAGAKIIFTGGSGSSVVAAMVDAATKHAARAVAFARDEWAAGLAPLTQLFRALEAELAAARRAIDDGYRRVVEGDFEGALAALKDNP
jgi:hypothetical protein